MSDRVSFTDSPGRLARFTRNGAGAVRVPVTAARTGVQEYPGKGPNGSTLRVYRAPEEVFHADALASYAGVPIVIGHPMAGVNPDNVQRLQVGHVSDLPPETHVKLDGSPHEWVRAQAYIADGATLDSIDAATEPVEVSCGYDCVLDHTPGTSPDGEMYHATQKMIRMNHLAIKVKARAGTDARLQLDSVSGAKDWLEKAIELHEKHMNGTAPTTGADGKRSQQLMMNQMRKALSELEMDTKAGMAMDDVEKNPKETMKIVVIDGAEFELGSEKHIAKLQLDHSTALKTATDKADRAEARADAEKSRADKAEDALKPAALDALVEARLTLLRAAAPFLKGDYETSGKSNLQICKDALEAAGVTVDGKSDVFIEARFEALTDSKTPAQFHNPGKAPKKAAVQDSDDAFRAELAKKLNDEAK